MDLTVVLVVRRVSVVRRQLFHSVTTMMEDVHVSQGRQDSSVRAVLMGSGTMGGQAVKVSGDLKV